MYIGIGVRTGPGFGKMDSPAFSLHPPTSKTGKIQGLMF